MTTRRLHLDPVGGIAGDMFVGAMLDAWPDHAEGTVGAIRAAGLADWVMLDVRPERGPRALVFSTLGCLGQIGVNEAGLSHNVNADEVAGALASALEAAKLILLTDIEGVRDGKNELISELTVASAEKYIAEGTIKDGMIPKVQCCLSVLESGVASAHVIDGRILHAILLEIFTDGGVGTLISG